MPHRQQSSLPQVTVVIPWGKLSPTLDRAISSALKQDLPPHEVIVVANGVVPKALIPEAADRYHERPVTFIYVPGCNNANVARNLGTALARAEYIAYLDSDDWWDPTHLRTSLSVLRAKGADMVYSGMVIHLPRGNTEDRRASDWRDYGSMESYSLNYQAAQTSSLVVRKSAALIVMWDVSLSRHQDYDFKARFTASHKTTFKDDITVHVDWQEPRRNRHHADCFRVLNAWRPSVEDSLYRRHYWNLCRSALSSRDQAFVHNAPRCILYFISKLIQQLTNKLSPSARPPKPHA